MVYSLLSQPPKSLLLAVLLTLLPTAAWGQAEPTAWQVTVNSNADTLDRNDGQVTLREALTFLNGDRPLEKFSPRERLQIVPKAGKSRIQFQLPPDQTTISLTQVLPEVQAPGVVIDGSSQMQRQVDEVGTETLIPLIALTPAPEAVVPQGLILVADEIQVKALSIYGFNQPHTATAGSIVANVVVAHPGAPPSASQGRDTPYYFPFRDSDRAPQNIMLMGNWIGQAPNQPPETPRSAHGIYILNAENLSIQDNVIAHHQGAGIVTGFRAEGTAIERNVLEANGTAGLPDAIRLEGRVDRTLIHSTLLLQQLR
ncbi:MAG: hypothetical protein F6J87_19805 [Spirulina sp. SIO3F2]|nr:hypothetical protein [Spirulina sp. SIO3F2]